MAEESPALKRLASRLYLFLVLLGVFFYFAWSLVFNTWDLTKAENQAVYAVTILLVGFGATGWLLYRPAKPMPENGKEP